MATTTTTTAPTVGGGTTVDNLNVLDTSKSNDTGGNEFITLLEVATALFPTTNATQTLTIDSSFWSGGLRLTFSIGGQYYTIWGATSSSNAQSIQIAQTDALGSYATALTATAAGTLSINPTWTTTNDINQFLTFVSANTGTTIPTASSVSSSLLV